MAARARAAAAAIDPEVAATLAFIESTEYLHVRLDIDPLPAPRPRTAMTPALGGSGMMSVCRQALALYEAGEKGQAMRKLFALFHARIHNPREYEKWKSAVASALEHARRGKFGDRPIVRQGEALEVMILCVFPLPKSLWRKTASKQPGRSWHAKASQGDWDNLGKPVCDAATGVLWHDDCQVARGTVEKLVGAQGERPRVELLVRPIMDAPTETLLEAELRRLGVQQGRAR